MTENDIQLFFKDTVYTTSDNEMRSAFVEGVYIAKENTAYVEQGGGARHILNKYPIPDRIPKTKEDILRYLKEEVKDECAKIFGNR